MAESKSPRILGVTLARGGSKSIEKKNIRPFAGHPLIAYTIAEAKRSKLLTRYVVSSDDDDIRKVALQYGGEAPFRRPEELSTDTASALSADQHATQWAEDDEGQPYDYVVELMATNPMKTAEDIDAALSKLIDTGADSVIGVTKLDDHHPIRIKKIVDDRIVNFCLPEIAEMHRQQLKPDAYIRNGAIYAVRRDELMAGRRYGQEDSRPYIMDAERSVNIDGPIDALVAEYLLDQDPRDYIAPVMSEDEALAKLATYKD